jgi:dipeptidyl-peptidase-4
LHDLSPEIYLRDTPGTIWEHSGSIGDAHVFPLLDNCYNQSVKQALPLWLALAVSLTTMTVSSSSYAQGTKADYERADKLPGLMRGKVSHINIRPNWIAGGNRFWYINNLGDDKREYILVDPAAGKKAPAFDHEKLAAALSKSLGKTVAPDRLPLDLLEFGPAPDALRIQSGGRSWHVNFTTYALTEDDASLTTLPALSPETAPRASRNTGAETSVVFVNKSGADASLFWLDLDGIRQPYGTVPAGAERQLRTYAGHVWLIVGKDNKPLVVFVGGAQPGTAVIPATPPAPQRNAPPGPRRGGGGLSPDGKWAATVRDSNVFLRNIQTNEETALTKDGVPDNRYVNPLSWSPDSKKLVVNKEVPAQEHKIYIVESSPKDQKQPKLHDYNYLKPGDRIDHPRPHLFDIETKRDIPIADDLLPTPWDISTPHWAPDSASFQMIYNQRGHQILRVLRVDAVTGAVKTTVDEQSKTFIDYAGKFFIDYQDKTNELIWMSERSGWNHLYLFDTRTGQVKNPITKGNWVVRGVDRVDSEKRQIWFRAGGVFPEQDPYYIHYGRVNFDGTGLTWLTSGDGTHTVTFSPDNQFYVDTYSRVDLPPVTELHRTDTGALVLPLEKGDDTALKAMGLRYPERFVAMGRDGKTPIYGIIFRPTNFDPKKRYPVIEQIYAGPQSSFVPKSFGLASVPQLMAELGFITVQIDGMGTSDRSKAFHDVCWKNLGDAGFPDRILWMQAAAKKYPYMDISRVGVYGGSAGGQNAARAVMAFGDFYKAAVADCGCHDNQMDKIWWNELWMGWPIGPEYDAQSNVTNAKNLKGNLMLIVGEMDTNVDPASTMQVVDALIKADKDFDLLVVPGAGHGAGGSPYGRRRTMDFFVRHLLGVEPRLSPAVSQKTE